MNTERNFNLIKGEFDPIDSREILSRLFSNEIRFYQQKNFISKEQLGREDETAMKRIPELTKDLLTIQNYLDEVENNEEFIEIFAEIKVNVLKPKLL